MKKVLPLILIFFSCGLCAQKLVYSETISGENNQISFEILGKVANNYVIYKNVRMKHMLAVYDQDMKLLDNNRLEFIPERTFNLDFITYDDHFYIIYQYQKRNTIWCKAVKMSSTGEKLSEPVTLDTSRTGLIADKKIYNAVFSEDRKKILIYKMIRRNDELTIVTKLYNTELKMLDSTRQLLPFDDRRDVYSEIFVDNDGAFLFAKERKNSWNDNVIGLTMIVRKPGMDSAYQVLVPLQDRYIDEAKIRIDNLNGNYIVNSLFSKKKSGSIDGLFTVVIDKDIQQSRSVFNVFSDSLRNILNSGGKFSTAFDDLYLRNTFVKKDGSFIITAEDYYAQSANSSNNYRRYDNLYSSPYSSSYSYYLSNPTYTRYYRPYNSFDYLPRSRYFYDDILIFSIDSSLRLKWSTVIPKKQEDVDQDNFLSFANVNSGAEIHFLFTDSKKNQLVNNHSILPNGQVKRYATLKSYEAGYDFMPKLAKQVGARQVIVPCIYRGLVVFAKVDFSE